MSHGPVMLDLSGAATINPEVLLTDVLARLPLNVPPKVTAGNFVFAFRRSSGSVMERIHFIALSFFPD